MPKDELKSEMIQFLSYRNTNDYSGEDISDYDRSVVNLLDDYYFVLFLYYTSIFFQEPVLTFNAIIMEKGTIHAAKPSQAPTTPISRYMLK